MTRFDTVVMEVTGTGRSPVGPSVPKCPKLSIQKMILCRPRPAADAAGRGFRLSHPRCLKNCTARSWAWAASLVENVPRFRLFPVFGSFFREYRRYPPDFSLRILGHL